MTEVLSTIKGPNDVRNVPEERLPLLFILCDTAIDLQ